MDIKRLTKYVEQTRRELLSKQKRESPARVHRAQKYSVTSISINPEAFLSNWLVLVTKISGNGHSYDCNIAFEKVVSDLIESAKNSSNHYVNGHLILASLKRSLDNNDIYISCTCPDFKYRYDYWATQGKYKWGKLQPSNGKGIRNKNNDIGSMCKHLYALLKSNVFMNQVSDKIMRTIMANMDVLVNKYEIDLDTFIVNSAAYDRLLKSRQGREKSGRFTTNKINNSDNNSEENTNNNLDNSNTEGDTTIDNNNPNTD